MSKIKYYSTNLKAEQVNFSEALLKGLAPDGGLYMPNTIPKLSRDEIASFKTMAYNEIAYLVLSKYLSDLIPDKQLAKMTKDAYNFEVPLEKVFGEKYIMRLDQGPTASFKDFAARMMGQLMQFFLQKEHKDLLILTATSGDTGSAMANAFLGLHNIKVCVLYPEAEVTPRQRKQMTTLHENIEVISLDGKFDDCQALVKLAFNERELDYLHLSSANSINIGRLLPQSVYYIYAYSKLCDIHKDEEIIFSVPSGNFGDLMGGLLAKNMGLPVKKFVVATNLNDEVPSYFESGIYQTIAPSKACISSAMNVGHPSNMARIVDLYGGNMTENGAILKQPDLDLMKNDMYATSVDDASTRETIKRIYSRHQVLLEPHGSVAWDGLRKYLNDTPEANADNQVCVSLETAHPAKFPEEINHLLGIDPELPPSLLGLDGKEEIIVPMKYDFQAFKAHLIKTYS